jgi:outer membrane protein assembly factor BamD
MLSKFKISLILTFFFFFLSCGDKVKKEKILVGDSLELQMIEIYKEGLKELKKGDALLAAKKFNEAELLYPQSEWAAKSALMAAYTYYKSDYYYDAIYELKRFIKTYPLEPKIDYAHYLLAICYYEEIENEKRDLQPLISAKQEFNYIINNYPSTDFALDSKFKIGLIDEIIAAKEMYIGRHYIKKQKWIPAINRFKNILKDYDTTVYAEEAIHRLVEIHYRIGLESEAKKYASLLGYNYLSSEWYKKSYKIFNTKYQIKQNVIEKNRKDKSGLIQKFKKIF